METEIKNPTFARWLQHVFDHPVKSPQWYFDWNAEFYNTEANPHLTVEYVKRLFESPGKFTQGYSDAQINQGFYYIINNSASNHIFALLDNHVPLEMRVGTIQAMVNVFEQIFAPNCSPHLSHTIYTPNVPDLNPLNRVCYMWWDVIPLYGKSGDPNREVLDEHCIDVMKQTLWLDSIACRESALHGLGHWKYAYPRRVQKIIDQFLKRFQNISPGLRDYALDARTGQIQ